MVEPTAKQKKAAKLISENLRNPKKTKGELLKEAGYSDQMSKSPSYVTETLGFKQEMAKYGLTEELISCALVEDIKAKPKNRKGELELGSKILGMANKGEGDKPELNIYQWGSYEEEGDDLQT